MPGTRQWCFGPFRLDPTTESLWRDEVLLPLPPKPFAVLAYLVVHAGQVVSKETLLDAVWPNTAVTEGVLKTCLGQIRQVLGETARAPQYIATLHRRGYRFVASVVEYTEAIPASTEVPPLETPDLPHHDEVEARPPALSPPEAERRQLTVLFCDLVDSTGLAGALTRKSCREVVRAYQETCAKVMPALRGISPSISAMACWSTLAIPWRMKMTPSGPCGPGWGCSRPWANSIPAWRRSGGSQLAVRLGIHTGPGGGG